MIPALGESCGGECFVGLVLCWVRPQHKASVELRCIRWVLWWVLWWVFCLAGAALNGCSVLSASTQRCRGAGDSRQLHQSGVPTGQHHATQLPGCRATTPQHTLVEERRGSGPCPLQGGGEKNGGLCDHSQQSRELIGLCDHSQHSRELIGLGDHSQHFRELIGLCVITVNTPGS